MDNIKKIRTFLLIFIVFILLLAVYFIQSKKNTVKKTVSVAKIESGISKFHLIEQTPSKVNWELWADEAHITSKEQVSDLIKPRVRFFLDTISEPIEIQSDKGNLNSITKKISLNDNVIATTGKLEIKMDNILWVSDGSQLETESIVFIKGEQFHVEGLGLKAYVKEEKVELLNNVKGQIFLESLPGNIQ
ncbi:MAG: LPS export ABC transporter periplasmic protein LptC [Nitrospinae bacterium]|nr:LPS export ABC transporter periplasmic protein LptC [Nitrospinota bacterium]